MSIRNLIKIDIEKAQKELERLKSIIPEIDDKSIKKCPNCKTKNYHYNTKTNSFCCAYC